MIIKLTILINLKNLFDLILIKFIFVHIPYVFCLFSSRYPLPEKPRQKRAVIQDMVRPLKKWLLRHRHNPYPTKAEKVHLALGSNMTLVQVSNQKVNTIAAIYMCHNAHHL